MLNLQKVPYHSIQYQILKKLLRARRKPLKSKWVIPHGQITFWRTFDAHFLMEWAEWAERDCLSIARPLWKEPKSWQPKVRFKSGNNRHLPENLLFSRVFGFLFAFWVQNYSIRIVSYYIIGGILTEIPPALSEISEYWSLS